MQTAGLERDRNVQGVLGTAFTATWRRAHGLHALTLPLDVERTKTVRSGPSGSADHTGLHAQGRVAVPPTLPLDVERTKTVRSGPSGSAIHMERCAQGRVAVPTTLPLDSERTAARPHTATRRRAYRNGALRAEWQCRRVGGRGARRGRLRAQGHARARRRAGQGVCRLLGRRARGAQARPAARNMSGPSPLASPERCRRRRGPQAAPASRGPFRGRQIAPGAASAGSVLVQ